MASLCALLALLALGKPARAATHEEIKAVAREMVCLCGVCNRASLATCQCSEFAVPQREEIGRALDEGKTKKEIVADFVEHFGPIVLAAPPARGYNLLPWMAPFVLLALGVVAVRSVLLHWRRPPPIADPATPSPPATPPPGKYRERLRRELEDFES